jgi:hypothetical protein
MTTLQKVTAAPVVKQGRDRTFRFVLSTGAVDRMNDTIDPTGWLLDEYTAAGGRVLWAHQHDIPAIARSTWIGVVAGKLVADAQFPPPGIHPFADTIHDLIAADYLAEASVGFDAIEWRPNEHGGQHFTKQVLIEWSVVNVPALPEARLVGRAEGLDRVAVSKWLGTAKPALVITDDAPAVVVDEPESRVLVVDGVTLTEAEVIAAIKDGARAAARQALMLLTGRVD